jgi:hypothetical protein|tara:strand:- start:545 stop:703 length:159 start_codon:yes stop_codon:yes gene_type:complete
MLDQYFGDLRACGVNRIQTGHGLLKDHSNFFAPNGSHLLLRQLREIPFPEVD